MGNMAGVLSEAGTAYHLQAPGFNLVYSWARVAQSCS